MTAQPAPPPAWQVVALGLDPDGKVYPLGYVVESVSADPDQAIGRALHAWNAAMPTLTVHAAVADPLWWRPLTEVERSRCVS